MGNWQIFIEGVGPHHNKDYPDDANKKALEFVRELEKRGQTIIKATFTTYTPGRSDDFTKILGDNNADS